MYHVTVFVNNEAVDTRDFSFGTWKEIGFWLDNYGYNDPEYNVKIKFSK